MSGIYTHFLQDLMASYRLGAAVSALYDHGADQLEHLSHIFMDGWERATIENMRSKAGDFLTETQRLAGKAGNFVYEHPKKTIAGIAGLGVSTYLLGPTIQDYAGKHLTRTTTLSFVMSLSLSRWAKATGNDKALREIEQVVRNATEALQAIGEVHMHLSEAQQKSLDDAQEAMHQAALKAAPNEETRKALIEQHTAMMEAKEQAREQAARAIAESKRVPLSPQDAEQAKQLAGREASSRAIVATIGDTVGSLDKVNNAVGGVAKGVEHLQQRTKKGKKASATDTQPATPEAAEGASLNSRQLRLLTHEITEADVNLMAMFSSYQTAKTDALESSDALDELRKLNMLVVAVGNTAPLMDELNEEQLEKFARLMENPEKIKQVLIALANGDVLDQKAPPALIYGADSRPEAQQTGANSRPESPPGTPRPSK